MTPPVVSVVVPSYRPGPLLERCVESLLAQDGGVPYEVIVVDSTADGTAERLRERHPGCRVIALATRTPQGEARNVGVAAAAGTYIALTDHDCLVPRDWLTRLLARHAAGEYHAVAGAVANGTPTNVVGTASYWIEFNDFTPGRPAGLVDDVPHCNVCFRRDALAESNPFPHAPSCAEDLTFNHLFRRSGRSIFFDPAIVVRHVNRTILSDFLAHQRVLGAGSAAARRLVPLPGQVAVRHPAVIPLLIPLRVTRVLGRVARRHPRDLPKVLALTPLFILGYGLWAQGFRAAASEPLNVRPLD